LLSLKHELRVMIAQQGGSIVNISSTYGHEGAAFASVYAGSKHAIPSYNSAFTSKKAGGAHGYFAHKTCKPEGRTHRL
jgi:short-subunit dehydrogenase